MQMCSELLCGVTGMKPTCGYVEGLTDNNFKNTIKVWDNVDTHSTYKTAFTVIKLQSFYVCIKGKI